jgi:methionine-rich copper-binding protein CopC
MSLWKAALAAIAVLVALGALVSPARAHAAYKDSDPPDEGTVSSPPSQVTAEFTEPLANGSYLQVFSPCGDRVDGGDVSIVGYEMSVSMGSSYAGLYSVDYRAFSQLDPHVTTGTFTFTSTGGDPCPGDEPDDPDPARPQPGDGPLERQSGDGPGSTAGSGGGGGPRASGDAEAREEAADGSRQPTQGRGRRSQGSSGPGGFRLAQDADPAPDDEAPPVWEGIEPAPFLAGLGLALLIGAAGGKIYAGIMGPRA